MFTRTPKFFFWYKKENRKWIQDKLNKVGRSDLVKRLLPNDQKWKKKKDLKDKEINSFIREVGVIE